MAKIKKIEIINFKALDAFEADFNGCTAIIVGGNNKGKTSFLRGIPDRIRGEKPQMVVTFGQKEGKGVLHLTTNERFEWHFNADGKDKLTFVTKDGYSTNVSKEIAKKFFPPLFDIDVFLNSTPKEQSKQFQRLVGIDFTEIDAAYKTAYDNRTLANRILANEKVRLNAFNPIPEKTETVDLTELNNKKKQLQDAFNKLYQENKLANEKTRKAFEELKELTRVQIDEFNKNQDDALTQLNDMNRALSILIDHGYKGNEVEEWIMSLPAPEKKKTIADAGLVEPTYIAELPDDSEIKLIDAQISNANTTNQKAQNYVSYCTQKTAFEKAELAAQMADDEVKDIELKKANMIESAKLPDGITFNENGIMVDGFPLDKNQISTSKLYCTALRLASLGLGEVKTLHFDASPLDKKSLEEIEKWAVENDCQLLIERPDFDGGEIKYELIETPAAI